MAFVVAIFTIDQTMVDLSPIQLPFTRNTFQTDIHRRGLEAALARRTNPVQAEKVAETSAVLIDY